MPPDRDRIRLATEALARARADAWSRGDRPHGTAGPRHSPTDDPERTPATVEATLPPGWSARPRQEDPQPLTAALGGLLSARGWRDRAAVGKAFGNWPEIVGTQLAGHTRPDSFDDGELTVAADSDAWATQLRLLAPKLLSRLAEELGAGTVRRIRVIGPSRASGGRAPRRRRTTP
jgi:predicted nucleic acid-binding Zn ribbon protein